MPQLARKLFPWIASLRAGLQPAFLKDGSVVDGDGKVLLGGGPKKATSSGTALDILGGTWTLAQTASGGSAILSNTYPIKTQPGVTPLLLTGTSSGASQYERITQAVPVPFLARDIAITVPVYVPDYTKVAQIVVQVSSDAFASKNFGTFYTPEFNGLHMVGISKKLIQTYSGGQVYAASGGMTDEELITHVRVQMTLATSVTGAISIGKPVVGSSRPGQIMMTVDDGEALIMRQLDSTLPWSPYDYATRSGIKLSFFLISALIGTAGYLTAKDVQRILADGHRIYPHGATNLASLADDAARRADVEANIAGLVVLGVPRDDLLMCYAYPNGVFETSPGDTSILQILIDKGFRLARTASRRAIMQVQAGFHRPYTMPIIGYYENVGSGGETLAIAQGRLNDLAAVGGLAILTNHKFVIGTPSVDLEIKFSDWRALLDTAASLKAAGSLVDVTPHDVVQTFGLTVPTLASL